MMDSLRQRVSDGLKVVRDTFTSTWQSVSTGTTAGVSGLGAAVSNGMSNVRNALSNSMDHVKTTWQSIWKGMAENVGNTLNNIPSQMRTVIADIAAAVMRSGGIISMSFANVFDNVLNFIGNLGGQMWGAGQPLLQNLWNGMTEVFSRMLENVSWGLQQLRNMLPGSEPKDPTSPLRGLADRGRAIIDNMIPGMEAGFADMDATMRDGLAGAADITTRSTEINVTAQYGYQPERSLRDDLHMLRLLEST
jgi:phage-related protein